MGFLEESGQFGSQTGHFFFKRFSVVFLFLNSDVAAGGEDVILPFDGFQIRDGAEPLDFRQGSFLEGLEGIGQLLYIFL